MTYFRVLRTIWYTGQFSSLPQNWNSRLHPPCRSKVTFFLFAEVFLSFIYVFFDGFFIVFLWCFECKRMGKEKKKKKKNDKKDGKRRRKLLSFCERWSFSREVLKRIFVLGKFQSKGTVKGLYLSVSFSSKKHRYGEKK